MAPPAAEDNGRGAQAPARGRRCTSESPTSTRTPACLAAAVTAFALVARAADRDFTICNRTGSTIAQLHASPTATAHWGADLLGSGALPHGRSMALHYAPSMYRGQCVFDLEVVDADERCAVVSAVDLCTVTPLTFARQDGRVVFRAQ